MDVGKIFSFENAFFYIHTFSKPFTAFLLFLSFENPDRNVGVSFVDGANAQELFSFRIMTELILSVV